MKTPKAEKLPSGNWRVKVQIDGKRYSCTAPTKKEAQDKAAKLYAGIQMEKRSPLTVALKTKEKASKPLWQGSLNLVPVVGLEPII